MKMPASFFSSSAPNWVEVPLPADPKLSLPGLALANVTRSARVFNGLLADTTMTDGVTTAWPIAIRSRSGL